MNNLKVRELHRMRINRFLDQEVSNKVYTELGSPKSYESLFTAWANPKYNNRDQFVNQAWSQTIPNVSVISINGFLPRAKSVYPSTLNPGIWTNLLAAGFELQTMVKIAMLARYAFQILNIGSKSEQLNVESGDTVRVTNFISSAFRPGDAPHNTGKVYDVSRVTFAVTDKNGTIKSTNKPGYYNSRDFRFGALFEYIPDPIAALHSFMKRTDDICLLSYMVGLYVLQNMGYTSLLSDPGIQTSFNQSTFVGSKSFYCPIKTILGPLGCRTHNLKNISDSEVSNPFIRLHGNHGQTHSDHNHIMFNVNNDTNVPQSIVSIEAEHVLYFNKIIKAMYQRGVEDKFMSGIASSVAIQALDAAMNPNFLQDLNFEIPIPEYTEVNGIANLVPWTRQSFSSFEMPLPVASPKVCDLSPWLVSNGTTTPGSDEGGYVQIPSYDPGKKVDLDESFFRLGNPWIWGGAASIMAAIPGAILLKKAIDRWIAKNNKDYVKFTRDDLNNRKKFDKMLSDTKIYSVEINEKVRGDWKEILDAYEKRSSLTRNEVVEIGDKVAEGIFRLDVKVPDWARNIENIYIRPAESGTQPFAWIEQLPGDKSMLIVSKNDIETLDILRGNYGKSLYKVGLSDEKGIKLSAAMLYGLDLISIKTGIATPISERYKNAKNPKNVERLESNLAKFAISRYDMSIIPDVAILDRDKLYRSISIETMTKEKIEAFKKCETVITEVVALARRFKTNVSALEEKDLENINKMFRDVVDRETERQKQYELEKKEREKTPKQLELDERITGRDKTKKERLKPKPRRRLLP